MDPTELIAHVQASTVKMETLKQDAQALENAVRGHLEDIAKVCCCCCCSYLESSV